MFINGVVGYTFMHEGYYPNLAKEGRAVHELTEGRPYIYLMSNEGIADIGVDVGTKQNNGIVYTNDFINCLQRNNGVYKPYVPEQMRGMASVRETADVDTLIVDYDTYPFLQLSENVDVSSPNDRGSVYVIRFTPGERIVDSTLSNLNNKVLSAGKPGILLLYNEDFLQRPLTVRLKISSPIAQAMTVNSTHELQTVDLTPEEEWYEVAFNKAEEAFNFQTKEASITVLGYELIVGK